MISNSTYAPLVEEIVDELAHQGLNGLSELFSKLFNELMKAEREQVLQAGPYERADARKGYANGFKNKMLQNESRSKLLLPACCRTLRWGIIEPSVSFAEFLRLVFPQHSPF